MLTLESVTYKNILNIPALQFQKDVTCILGESGSGKSTLLKLLSNMISPTSGRILFHNTNIAEIRGHILRSQITTLTQAPIIYRGTIKENLTIGLTFQEKECPSDAVLYALLSSLKLSKDLQDDCEKLSGGEKQRICIGRVLLLDSEVLLLDEPSSALDENTEEQVVAHIASTLATQNRKLILVTHRPEIAHTYASHIVTLTKGEITNEQCN